MPRNLDWVSGEDVVTFGLGEDAVTFGLGEDAVTFGLGEDAVTFVEDAVTFGLGEDVVTFGDDYNLSSTAFGKSKSFHQNKYSEISFRNS
jgi:hypothetical protein